MRSARARVAAPIGAECAPDDHRVVVPRRVVEVAHVVCTSAWPIHFLDPPNVHATTDRIQTACGRERPIRHGKPRAPPVAARRSEPLRRSGSPPTRGRSPPTAEPPITDGSTSTARHRGERARNQARATAADRRAKSRARRPIGRPASSSATRSRGSPHGSPRVWRSRLTARRAHRAQCLVVAPPTRAGSTRPIRPTPARRGSRRTTPAGRRPAVMA